MHVLMLSDLETQGGAAIAASRLALGLIELGHRVTRVVRVRDGQAHAWATTEAKADLGWTLGGRLLRGVAPPTWRRTGDRRATARRLASLLRHYRPDAINVNNVHWATSQLDWSLELVGLCAETAPTAWTLHDMWSFTGRCAYSYDCRRFAAGCDAACPTPGEYPALAPRDIAAAWGQRQRLLRAHPHLAAIAPSAWLAREAHAGLWAGHRVEVIPCGVPLDRYRPLRRDVARAALGLEAQGPVLLVAAQSLCDRRKGGMLLVEALHRLPDRQICLLTLGEGEVGALPAGVQVYALGSVRDERLLPIVYSAADVLVHPALADNLPNVVLEALACGTPTVALPVGGLPEMVRPGQTGWLAGAVSGLGLGAALGQALVDLAAGMDLSSCCRAIAEREFALPGQARRYVELLESMRQFSP